MTTRLTEEDFKNAMFAVLPKYGLRAHKSAGDSYWQRDGINRATNAEMAAAGWRPVREAAPLTLDSLREAWESTSVPSVVHVGDTIIQRDPLGESFSVFEAERDYPRPPLDIRVLHRAPRREPWQALADVLADMGHMSPTGHAKALHERGVTVSKNAQE